MKRTRTVRRIVGGRGVLRSGTTVGARRRPVGARQVRRIGRRWAVGTMVSFEENATVGVGRRRVGVMAARRRRAQGLGEQRRRRIRGEARRRRSRGQLGALARREVNERWEMYLARERRALSTYVRVSWSRGSAYATEAGRKYFFVGALGSTRRVRGRVRRYGHSGRRKRSERARWGERSSAVGASTSGSGRRGRQRRRWVRWFKRGARPMHRWVADVYEGAPSRMGRYRRMVPKRAVSRRRARIRRISGRFTTAEDSEKRRGRRAVRATATRTVGGRGLAVQRRWKRYRAYSGRSTVGQRRRAARRRSVQGEKGLRRTLRMYYQRVRRTWGTRRRRRVERESYGGTPAGGKEVREVKYRKDRSGRRKRYSTMARRRVAARMSLLGRPPRLGFGAKRAVYGGRVGMGGRSPLPSGLRRGGTARRRSRVGAYGYLRMAKRRTMEARAWPTTVPSRERKTQRGGEGRRRRTMEKPLGRRRGRRSRRRARVWRNGEGMERRREGSILM